MILTRKNCIRISRAFMMAVAVMMFTSALTAEEKKDAEPKEASAEKVRTGSGSIGSSGSLLTLPKSIKPEAKAADPFVVPDGTPEELFAYIQRVGTMQPEDQSNMAAMMAFVKKSSMAIITAADKIMASPKITDEQFTMAFRVKVDVLQRLLRIRDAKAMEILQAFPAQLKKLNKPELAKAVEGQLLLMELIKAANKLPDSKPLHEVIEQINAMVGDKIDRMSFTLVMQTFQILTQLPEKQESDRQEIIAFCNKYAKMFAADENPQVVEVAKYLEGVVRRLDLNGKPMKIVGKTIDGAEFDWAAYKGKVVLVMFWSTSCSPCREIMPKIVEDYKKYHDQGFDVVGINLDPTIAPVQEYLKEMPLPWTTVFNGSRGENDKAEPNLPNATYYSVNAVPELILVGRDGKVIANGMTGPEMVLEMKKLFGAKDEKKPAGN